ncbi:hypothetical protein ABHD31_08100 [Enterobacter cloacae]|uniref:phage head spike fiber domain-containing protein n=1 Tax=Enterobacter cloacae TaxID=550 RepID=UPI00325AC3C4
MKGLYVPGAVIIGNIGSNSGGSADLSDIDLTLSSLDPRLSYQCVSHHAYYAADGTIQFAEPDVWPLEYRNGLVVGRHDPEPQRTNLFTYSDNLSATPWIRNGDVVDVTKSGPPAPYGTAAFAVEVGEQVNSGVFIRSPMVAGEVYTISLAGHADDVRTMLIGDSYLGYQSVRVNFNQRTSTLSSPFVYRFSDVNDEWVRYAVSGAATNSGTPGFIIYSAEALAGTYSAAMIQHEAGAFVTSPIITEGTSATRAAAFASVKNPGGLATSIRVTYSDSTTVNIDFPAGGADVQLPQSAVDWGTRYIQRIEYLKS